MKGKDSDKLLRVIQRNKCSKIVNIPAEYCKLLNINRHDILSSKLDKTRIILEKLQVE